MTQNTQLIALGIVISAAIAIITAVSLNMRKQRKAREEKEREAEEKRVANFYASKSKKKRNTEPPPVLDKEITLKRPGKRNAVYSYYKNEIVEKLLKDKRISFTAMRIVDSRYVELKNQPGRKKAKGYWQYTVKYAA